MLQPLLYTAGRLGCFGSKSLSKTLWIMIYNDIQYFLMSLFLVFVSITGITVVEKQVPQLELGEACSAVEDLWQRLPQGPESATGREKSQALGVDIFLDELCMRYVYRFYRFKCMI